MQVRFLSGAPWSIRIAVSIPAFQAGGADKKQVKLEDIQKAVKTVEGTKNAYVNAADAAVYCVDADGKTTKVEL